MPSHSYQLGPSDWIPSGYEDYLTQTERSDHIRQTAKGLAGLPILHDEAATTNRAFQTWSLFLISNPAWLGPDGPTKIKGLYDSYHSFAFAVGDHHAAVWFGKVWPDDAVRDSKEPPLQVDTERGAEYCTKLGLDLAKSPHVVVATRYPSLEEPLDDCIVLELNGLSPESTLPIRLTHTPTRASVCP